MSGPRKRNRNPEKVSVAAKGLTHSGYQRTVPAPDFPESCSQCKQVQRAAAAGTPGLSRSPSNSASSSIAVTGRV
ncbi:uncharacterized protein LOC144377423 isoform X5 [Ictidomys tridecemlineatus]